MIYWFYDGTRPIYATIAPPGASDDEVRAEALHWHGRIPHRWPEYSPAEFAEMLRLAVVRRD